MNVFPWRHGRGVLSDCQLRQGNLVECVLDSLVDPVPMATQWASRLDIAYVRSPLDTGGEGNWSLQRFNDLGDGDLRFTSG